MTAILNSRWWTTNRKADVHFLDPESSHLHNPKPNCVEVDVHTGLNPPPRVHVTALIYEAFWKQLMFFALFHYDLSSHLFKSFDI